MIVTRKIKIAKNEIEVTYLGEIAEIKQGIATGDNAYYISVLKPENKTYKKVDENLILKNNELEKIIKNQKLRKEIANNGISKKMFSGRKLIPFDKGGTSEIKSARLSNYYFPTNYYMDWSEESVKRMKTFTVADIKKFNQKTNITEKNRNEIASRFLNTEYFFKEGITFSMTGIYSPTFRLNSTSVFQDKGSCIFPHNLSSEYLLGILCSKLCKYCLKSFINNSVDSTTDSIKLIPIPIKNSRKMKIIKLVEKIILTQKKDQSYDYQENEQKELDNLVNQSFGLESKHVEEVESWYDRKFPKLTLEN